MESPDNKPKKDATLKINGSFIDVLKVAVTGGKPKVKKGRKKKEKPS